MSEIETTNTTYSCKVNLKAFGRTPSPFGEDSTKDRKFNLKIRRTDLALLDSLAELYKVPRSTLINYLLLNGLIRGLRAGVSDYSESLEVMALIAYRADEKLKGTAFQRQASWVEDLWFEQTQDDFEEIMTKKFDYFPNLLRKVPLEYRHSKPFNDLKAFFEGLDNK